MNLQPIGDKVCILPDPIPEKYGRLYVPKDSDYRPRYGEVLAVGPGAWVLDEVKPGEWVHVRRPMTVKPGDRVAFSQYGTDGIETHDGREVLIIPEGKVLAVEKADSWRPWKPLKEVLANVPHQTVTGPLDHVDPVFNEAGERIGETLRPYERGES